MASFQPINLSAKRPRRPFRAIVAPDMTPMVGVGFLLVSFFLLTTTFEKRTVMQVTMPIKERFDENDSFCPGAGEILTVVLGKNSKIYYYSAPYWHAEKLDVHITDLSSTGLRKVLLAFSRRDLVLIKPSNEAKYQDMVDVLDEMNITDRKKYAMVDISAQEYDLIKNSRL